MLLPQILPNISGIVIFKYVERTYLDKHGYNNKRNANKKPLLLLKNYLVYNIFWLEKSNFFYIFSN